MLKGAYESVGPNILIARSKKLIGLCRTPEIEILPGDEAVGVKGKWVGTPEGKMKTSALDMLSLRQQ